MDIIKTKVKTSKKTFQCTFSIILNEKAVNLQKSKLSCSPAKPKRQNFKNLNIKGKLGSYIVSGMINPSNIKKAEFSPTPTTTTTTTTTPTPPTPTPQTEDCDFGYVRVCSLDESSGCGEGMFKYCPNEEDGDQASYESQKCNCLLAYVVAQAVSSGVSLLGCGKDCVCLSDEVRQCKTREFDALFIGPAGEGVDSMVYEFPSFKIANCTPPQFPFATGYRSYVATLTKAGPMFCGGIIDGVPSSACYFLTSSGAWEETKGMSTNRSDPAAVVMDAGWWVTGGSGEGFKPEISTEIWDGENWKSSINLPKPLYGHCMVKINSSHVFIAGGWDDGGFMAPHVASYIYNGVEFIQVANLTAWRIGAGCCLHDDHIFVFGGYPDAWKSRVFSLKTLSWSEGPQAEFGNGISVVSSNGINYIIGGTAIYRLSTTGENSWEVVKIIEWEGWRDHRDAFLMKLEDCKNWDA